MSIIEHEDDRIRIRFLDGHTKGPRFPKELSGSESYVQVPGRRVVVAVYHHTAGGFYEGIEAVDKIANYAIAPPKYAVDEEGRVKTHMVMGRERPIVIGGGRGWPGIPYTYVIPAYPSIEDGKLVIFKIWDDRWITWHTGGVYNHHGVGVCVGGWYASRHDLLTGHSNSHALAKPTEEAMTCADALADHLMARHGLQLGPDTLKCHAELGKPACPGSYLENWVRTKRGDGEIVDPIPGHEDGRPLETELQVQQALVELGYDPGKLDGIMGSYTSNAIRVFQTAERLRPDGIFGPITRTMMRQALARPR